MNFNFEISRVDGIVPALVQVKPYKTSKRIKLTQKYAKKIINKLLRKIKNNKYRCSLPAYMLRMQGTRKLKFQQTHNLYSVSAVSSKTTFFPKYLFFLISYFSSKIFLSLYNISCTKCLKNSYRYEQNRYHKSPLNEADAVTRIRNILFH